MLQFMRLQRVGDDLVTEQQQQTVTIFKVGFPAEWGASEAFGVLSPSHMAPVFLLPLSTQFLRCLCPPQSRSCPCHLWADGWHQGELCSHAEEEG